MNDRATLTLPDQRTLMYAEYGDPEGMPLVCLHGTPGSRRLFATIDQPARAHGIRIIAPDRPGCGGTDYKKDWTYADHMADLTALVDHLGLDKFTVLGLSGGGVYAAYAARTLRARLKALLLISPYAPGVRTGAGQAVPLFLARWSRPALRLSIILFLRTLSLLPNLASSSLRCGAGPADQAALQTPEIRQTIADCLQDTPIDGRGLSRDIELLRNFEIPPGGPEENIPVWIWHGTDDSVVYPEAALFYAKNFPKARMTLLPGASHYWGLTHAEIFMDALLQALRPDDSDPAQGRLEF